MVDENDIPFPLLSGQYVSGFDNTNQIRVFYQVDRQPSFFDLTYKYEISPLQKISDQTITLGTGSGALSVFRTKVPGMKQWVTWIDNDYLGVTWNVVDVNMNSLTGFSEPETKYTSPFGGISFPKFILNNSAGNVTFTLSNLSSTKTIAGTLHILMYEYALKKASGTPPYYTDIEYKGTGAGSA